jgi:hydroxymethylglutaryl-CoA reductase
MSAEPEVQQMIEAVISQLQRNSFNDIAALPEAKGQDVLIDGKKGALTTYVQRLSSGELLVTVQIASPILLGFGSVHTERGLIFSANGFLREATSEELQNTGG